MSRRHPGMDRLRGRHKKAASRETRQWLGTPPIPDEPVVEVEQQHRPLPPCPPWLDAQTYRKLAYYRRRRRL